MSAFVFDSNNHTVLWPTYTSLCLRVIEIIFAEVDKHIDTGDLIQEYKMSALPSLYDHFVKLIKYLVMLFLW